MRDVHPKRMKVRFYSVHKAEPDGDESWDMLMWKASRPAFKTFHPHRNVGFNPELLAQVIHTGIHMALLEKTPRSHDEKHHVFPMKLAFSVHPPVLGHIQISHHFGEIANHIPSYPIISR